MMPEDKKPSRVFLITPEFKARGGREQLSGLLMQSLLVVTEDQLEVFRLSHPDKPLSVPARLMGRIDGVTPKVEQDLLSRLSDAPPDSVFIDGSNLGRLARVLKRANLPVPIITFYHNVEARFFFDAFRASPSLHALGVLAANTVAERWATLYSDRRVLLNKRDARLLGKIYRQEGTDILPLALQDNFEPAAIPAQSPHPKPYALFVGGAFYANVEGMAWYAREVAPFAPIETVVIGRGMEAHKSRLEQWGGVHVVGAVEDLGTWYSHSQIVVAPILSGSGMKTKTAEALMHGKPIVGTPEAFVGYRSGWTDQLNVCEEPTQFIDALQDAAKVEPGFDHSLRAHFDRYHSEEAMRSRLTKVLRRTLQDNELRNISVA